MSFFKKKEPRIAFEQRRDGGVTYFVETWKCYESGCMWSQESKRTDDLDEAKKMLEEIRNKEIVRRGALILQ